jgi:hypothetical protein
VSREFSLFISLARRIPKSVNCAMFAARESTDNGSSILKGRRKSFATELVVFQISKVQEIFEGEQEDTMLNVG